MVSFVHKNVRRVGNALRGIWFALRFDFSFKFQFFLGGLIYGAVGFLAWPLSSTAFLFLALSFFLILITELQNSSFESALDRLHPDLHEEIGRSKDMAAGAVLLSGIFALLVIVTILMDT